MFKKSFIAGLILTLNVQAADTVVFGMVNAQTGSSAALGIGVKKGVMAFLNQVNKSNELGVKFEVQAMDDGYEPARTLPLTERLLGNKNLQVLIGNVGTPTTVATLPLLEKYNVPMVGPFTGAESLRNPVIKNVFNIRASYMDETELLVDHLIKDKNAKKIAIFIQDDGYGAAGEAGVLKALKARNLELAGKGVYIRNTTDIDAGYAEVIKSNPDAVIIVGAYRASAAFTKKAKADKAKFVMANVSFVGTTALLRELGSDAEGVIVSQVLPSPFDNSNELVKDYQKAMTEAGEKEFDYTSLEGYVNARVVVEAYKMNKAALTNRDLFRETMNKFNSKVGGFSVSFSETNHSGSTATFLTVFKGGKVVQVAKL